MENIDLKTEIISSQLLIAGSGLAGLIACLEAAEQGINVTLITSDNFGTGATFTPIKATLGIQVTGENDQEKFLEDMEHIGRGYIDKDIAKMYIQESPNGLKKLRELGFNPRLRADKRPACFAKYWRPIYLIDDWENTKKRIYQKLSNYPNVRILTHTTIIKIFKNEQGVAAALCQRDTSFQLIHTNGIIMATGGIASLYKHSLYPSNITGIGHGVLLDLGVEFTNLEFIQFIPAFTKPKYNILFGEHTLKYCTSIYANHQEVLPGINNPKYKFLWEERSTYAPFSCDFDCATIDYALCKINQSAKDFTLKFQPELYANQEDFYTTYLNWLTDVIGINMLEPLQIAHFAHSCNGGAVVDVNGLTNISGLYAIGELMAGVEGANRLGGNSVGLAMVMGKNAIAHFQNHNLNSNIYTGDKYYQQAKQWLTTLANQDFPELKTIQQIMDKCGNIIRTAPQLKQGLNALKNTKNKLNYWAKPLAYNQQLIAQALLTVMLRQKNSIGAHYREDIKTTFSPAKQYITYKQGVFTTRQISV